MKLMCERDALRAALAAVASRARNKSPIPILQHVLIDARAAALSLATTDLDTRSMATCPAEIAKAGAIAVSAERLLRLVDGMPVASQVSIELRASDLHIDCGKSRYKLPTLPAEDFPEMSAVAGGIELSLSAAEAKRMFSDPASALPTNHSRVYLCGGHLAQRDKDHVMVTVTDGVRLVRLVVENKAKLDRSYIIPDVAMAEIAKLATAGDVIIRCNDNLVEATCGSIVFKSKLVDATYPDADRVIPAVSRNFIKLERAQFTAALKRLAGLEDDNSTIDIKWKPGEPIEMGLVGNGSGTESLMCECDLEAGQIAFKPNVLKAALDVIDGDVIQLHVSGPGAPMRIVDPEDEALTVVAMPCRGRG